MIRLCVINLSRGESESGAEKEQGGRGSELGESQKMESFRTQEEGEKGPRDILREARKL